MPPFAQFRIWLRAGPAAEKTLAGAVLVVLLGLVTLALIPSHPDSGGAVVAAAGGGTAAASGTRLPTGTAGGSVPPATGSDSGEGTAAGGGAAPTGPAAAADAGSVSGVSAPSVPTGGAVAEASPSTGTSNTATTGATSSACGALKSTGPGVTATTVHVDLAAVDLAGPVVNSAFGIRPDAAQIVNAVVDDINKTGGIACGRRLIVTQYQVNPIDPIDQQSACLQMAQDNVLAVINFAGYVTPVSEECFVQNHIPLETATSIGQAQGASSYPYLFSPLSSSEEQVRDGILGLAARGAFKAPAFGGKLGVYEDNCLPSANQELARDLTASGVQSGRTSVYVLDCSLIAAPNEVLQAVLQNKLAGDTEVFLASSIANNQSYVGDADQQNFHPKYLTSDYGSNETPGQTWDAGFTGALAITSTHAGELDSGIHNPAEQTCNSILVSHGIRPLTNGASDLGATETCDLLMFLAQAIDHAGPNPTRTSLVEDLGTMGYFHSAFAGDADFAKPGRITGGDFQREIEYHTECQCWQVVDHSFGPAY